MVFNIRDWCSAWGTGVQHTRDWCLAQGTTQYLYMNSMTGHWLWKPTTFTTSPNRYRYKQDGLVITTSYSSPSSACNKQTKWCQTSFPSEDKTNTETAARAYLIDSCLQFSAVQTQAMQIVPLYSCIFEVIKIYCKHSFEGFCWLIISNRKFE